MSGSTGPRRGSTACRSRRGLHIWAVMTRRNRRQHPLRVVDFPSVATGVMDVSCPQFAFAVHDVSIAGAACNDEELTCDLLVMTGLFPP